MTHRRLTSSAFFLAAAIASTFGVAPSAFAADAAPVADAVIPFGKVAVTDPIVFDKHVFAILAEKCISCHNEEGGLAENDLDMMTAAAILKGGKRGASLVAGKGEESIVVKMASHAMKPVMPPKGDDPLTPDELALLKAWIDQGAKPGTNLTPGASLTPPVVLGALPPGV
ncbi:MAG: c-type cytochrome domain-containing protein, partial [Planctomycetia bacterium]